MPRPLFSLNFSTWATCHGNKDLDLRNYVDRMATITDYSNECSLLFDDSHFSSFKRYQFSAAYHYRANAQEPGSDKNNVMHERKECSLKKKLTTTSLLGPRISCHFFISSSSSKGVSFITWENTLQGTCVNIQNHKRWFKSFTASNATYIWQLSKVWRKKKNSTYS